MKNSITIPLLFLSSIVFGQINEDSLWSIWNNKNESNENRISAVHELTKTVYAFVNPDTARIIGHQGLLFAKSINDLEGQAKLHNDIGIAYYVLGQMDSTLSHFTACLDLSIAQNDTEGESKAYNNIGNIHYRLSDYPMALEFYHKSLRIKNEIKDTAGIASTSANIGAILQVQNNLDGSIEYLTKALELYRDLDNPNGLSSTYNNLGNVYNDLHELNRAIDMYNESVKIDREIGDINGLTGSLINLASAQFEIGEIEQALINYDVSYTLSQQLRNPTLIAATAYGLGLAKNELGFAKEALTMCDTAFYYATIQNDLRELKHSCRCYSETYESLGIFDKALKFSQLFKIYSDSILNDDQIRTITNQTALFKFEKKTVEDKLAHEKKAEIAKIKHDSELDQEKSFRYILYSGILLLLLFGVFILRSFILKKRAHTIIYKQKKEVELQKDIVEEKNREITDSIRYAKRLQEAILPPQRVVKEYLDNSFILYKPKDIVAGDFYWMETKGDLILLAAADCTGHGVPGAMVSVICSNALNKAVNELGITDPGAILDTARDIVVQRFTRSEDDVKDGMDVALCSLNLKTGALHYAGANNPLWIIRNDGSEIEEYKPSKQAVGLTDNSKPFKTHQIKLEKGDTIFMFTDGYADQFGGEKGKKLKTKSFKELLIQIKDKPMDQQKLQIDEVFENWKGDLEQIDDVCVIGVRI